MNIPDEKILAEYRRRKALSPDASRASLEQRTADALEMPVEDVIETLNFYASGLAG